MRLREEIAAHERQSRLQKQKEKEIKKKEAKLLKKQQRELKELIKALSYPDPFRRVWSKNNFSTFASNKSVLCTKFSDKI
jgi:hypothetical protein